MKYLLYACCFVLMDVILPREERGCSCRGSYPDPEPAVRPVAPVEDAYEESVELDILNESAVAGLSVAEE